MGIRAGRSQRLLGLEVVEQRRRRCLEELAVAVAVAVVVAVVVAVAVVVKKTYSLYFHLQSYRQYDGYHPGLQKNKKAQGAQEDKEEVKEVKEGASSRPS